MPKETTKEGLIIVGKLVLLAAVAAAVLAIIYVPTQTQIELNREEARIAALEDVVPEATDFEPVEEEVNDETKVLYYRALDADGNLIGYAFFGEQRGYEGIVEVAAGIDPDLNNLIKVKIISHSETPGLGDRIEDDSFLQQFEELDVDDLALTRDTGKVDSITGATVSSRAVVDAIDSKLNEMKETI
ncbi:Rnf electron transport complex subunit RnfG [Methanosalsum natronophilum]|uniref:Ion-translocating oxidoreductase complex subunit G n=1 Tax=Methanosalsum natronophilum TaxID=768733 RepID=A0A3R7XIZ3_9EURY|nr:Rnf electron transport complex subunit RnfG [Methanosalsum natronophilum]MCS3923097.1 electron transport complex protein RnfG [Methanosalsum natronophilum]RQD90110.1 MAG: RnfABCDGE type electron transport complex subunit G [Methanosalsum natronophilum]